MTSYLTRRLLLFIPLMVVAWTHPAWIWRWMDPAYNLALVGGHGTVSEDILLQKKSGFLNRNMFTAVTIGSFIIWSFLASRFSRSLARSG